MLFEFPEKITENGAAFSPFSNPKMFVSISPPGHVAVLRNNAPLNPVP